MTWRRGGLLRRGVREGCGWDEYSIMMKDSRTSECNTVANSVFLSAASMLYRSRCWQTARFDAGEHVGWCVSAIDCSMVIVGAMNAIMPVQPVCNWSTWLAFSKNLPPVFQKLTYPTLQRTDHTSLTGGTMSGADKACGRNPLACFAQNHNNFSLSLCVAASLRRRGTQALLN